MLNKEDKTMRDQKTLKELYKEQLKLAWEDEKMVG